MTSWPVTHSAPISPSGFCITESRFLIKLNPCSKHLVLELAWRVTHFGSPALGNASCSLSPLLTLSVSCVRHGLRTPGWPLTPLKGPRDIDLSPYQRPHHHVSPSILVALTVHHFLFCCIFVAILGRWKYSYFLPHILLIKVCGSHEARIFGDGGQRLSASFPNLQLSVFWHHHSDSHHF